MPVRIFPSGRVDCRTELLLPMTASAAWGQLRDFCRSASHDFFHSEIRIEGGLPRAGACLVLWHRFGPFTATRTGRILRWREFDPEKMNSAPTAHAAGFSFSDLCASDPQAAFPHVLSYHLLAGPGSTCRLIITVRGRWTARRVPRWAGRLWLAWVFHHVAGSVRNSLLAAALSRQSR